jgi:hypothetical protein
VRHRRGNVYDDTLRPSNRRTLQGVAAPQPEAYIAVKGLAPMPDERDNEGRPCLHCMMVELIDDFFTEYPVASAEPNTLDTDEVISAVAKTVAELTCSQDSTARQQIVENLMREIMDYDAEFRRDDASGAMGSVARH